MRKLTLALSAASLVIAGAAYAQPSPAPDGASGDRHQHAPQHGPMTRADAEAHVDKLFAKLDVNGDGKLDAADRDARRDQHRDQRFAKLDTDGNGAISRAEFAAAGDKARERFAEHAKRPDGQDGDHQFEGHKFDGHKFGSRRVAWGGHRGHGMHSHGGLAMAGKMADTNHDGAISKDEFETAALAMFDRTDANHDGTVTPDERKQMHSGHRGKHPSATG